VCDGPAFRNLKTNPSESQRNETLSPKALTPQGLELFRRIYEGYNEKITPTKGNKMYTIKFEDVLSNCILPKFPDWDTWTTDDQINSLEEFLKNIQNSEIPAKERLAVEMTLHTQILILSIQQTGEKYSQKKF
jgi:hypothetical protein